MTVGQIVEEIEKIAPPEIAMPDDPTGLQVGSRDWQVKTVMLALDADHNTVSQAVKNGAGLLLTHHPLINGPLSRIDTESPTGRAIELCLVNRTAVYSAHTNLDAAAKGINASLADDLDLKSRSVLLPTGAERLKLVTFVPHGSMEEVRDALFEAGAGHVGAYSRCSFVTHGEGTFFGGEGADPVVGEPGRLEKVQEARLEVVLPPTALPRAMEALRDRHPYERPAVDVYRMVSGNQETGIGLVGDLGKKTPVKALVSRLVKLLNARSPRFIGDPSGSAKRVALCAGSGAGLISSAVDRGADLYVTGDIKYHDARYARQVNLPVLDVGHFAPEIRGMRRFGDLLSEALGKRDIQVEIIFADEEDPFAGI